jgi:hypothetical protein
MDVRKVRELHSASPFKPFCLIMRDGRSLPVERPSYLGVSPNGLEITYARSEGGFEFIAVGDVQETVVDKKMKTPRRRRDDQ